MVTAFSGTNKHGIDLVKLTAPRVETYTDKV